MISVPLCLEIVTTKEGSYFRHVPKYLTSHCPVVKCVAFHAVRIDLDRSRKVTDRKFQSLLCSTGSAMMCDRLDSVSTR